MIGTKKECETAASQLGYQLSSNGELNTTENMKGCFITPMNLVRFNKISASSPTAHRTNRHGMCKKKGICVCIYIQFKFISFLFQI